jgi:DNA polymerase
VVYAYRKRNWKIKAGWAKCQSIIEDMARGRTGSYKCISWGHEVLYLPNGMAMRYPGLRDKTLAKIVARTLNPDLDDGEDFDPNWPEYVYDDQGVETKLYGGKLCENIVQALARIIVMTQMLNISRKERIVMTTHDENVAIAKAARAEKVSAFMQAEMMRPLAWCMDLPLNAEGGFDVIYSK